MWGRALAGPGCLLLAALACSPPQSEDVSQAAAWEEIASLPEPRWFHASGVDAKGRVYAFGGDIVRDGLQATGGKHYGPGVPRPGPRRVARAPETPPHRQNSRYFVRSGGVKTKPRFVMGERAPPIELPNGGSDGRRVYWFTFRGPIYFDSATGTWGQASAALFDQEEIRHEGAVPLYRRLGGATAADPDGRLWLLGGLGRPAGPEPPTLHRDREQLKNKVLDSLEVYDPKANTYTDRAPMHQPRWLFAASFGPDGKLYAFGGFGAEDTLTDDGKDPDYARKYAEWDRLTHEALRSVEAYDPQTDTWSPRAPLPEPRQNMAAALGADGKIYVIGGLPSYADLTAQRSVFVYDPARDSWSEGPPLRTPRQGHTAVATAEGRIYAIGGTNIRTKFHPVILIGGDPGEEGGPLASVEVLETMSGNVR